MAKGIKAHEGQLHICYCHTPVRYAWDLKMEYLKQIPSLFLKKMASWQLNKLKKWDLNSVDRVDHFIANSQFIAERIRNNYGRSSKVIYPPVNTTLFKPMSNGKERNEKYAITVSRMVPYKKIDLIIKAFNTIPDFKLKVIGKGPQAAYLKSIAGDNVEILGHQPFDDLVHLIRNSRVLILAAFEDFGITSLEAQACGIPVIALNKGGYLESVIEDTTGVLYDDQSVESLIDGFNRFIENESKFNPTNIRENAKKFEEDRFRNELMSYVNEKIDS